MKIKDDISVDVLTILPADEIDCIVTISDFILKFPNLSVGDIKKKFRLTSKEYEMIFDLCGFKGELNEH